MKRVYIAGPMQGYPNFNFPAFNTVAKALRSGGHEVFNPAEKDIERHGGDIWNSATGNIKDAGAKGFSLRQALADDLAYICNTADTIVMLPGWEKSNGAQAEHRTAVALQNDGMEIVYLAPEVLEAMEMTNNA